MLSRHIYIKILVLFLFLSALSAHAQDTFPQVDGDRVNYDMQINAHGNFISGICIMLLEDNIVKGSIVNDFGVSMMDFSYNTKKDKVKLHYVFNALNKWYIRRVLKRDLKKVMAVMRNGGTSFTDSRYRLDFSFKINHDIEK